MARSLLTGLFENLRCFSRRSTPHRQRAEAAPQAPKKNAQHEADVRLRYEEELERLRLENEQLRISAVAFGELAERLNQALKSAVRSGGRGATPIPRSR